MPIRLLILPTMILSFISMTGSDHVFSEETDLKKSSSVIQTSVKSSVKVTQPECDLILSVPKVISIEKGVQGVKAVIKNKGTQDLQLVLPGEKSHVRFRTPTINWAMIPADEFVEPEKNPRNIYVARCGSINALTPEEVFTLKPQASQELGQWIYFPTDRVKPGKYYAVLYYNNIPDHGWKSAHRPIDSGPVEHDAETMQRVKESDAISLISNPVLVEIVE